jgi:hypothetical protein
MLAIKRNQHSCVLHGTTTWLERTVESLFVYRLSQSAAAQPDRCAAGVSGGGNI